MGHSFGILNAIRNEASNEYQARIPEATQETIASIGNALQSYTPLYNEFCDALINKIGRTILESKLFENRLARFKQGTVMDQQDVEEIFVEMSKAESSYDPSGPNPLGRREGPDVKVIYHRQNRQDVYVITIGDIDFLRVFKSEATLDAFIKARIQSVYSGANHDEWLAMKKLLESYDGYATALIENPENGGNPIGYPAMCKEFVKTVRKLAQDMTFVSKKFNGAGVNTVSAPGDLVLLVNKDLLAELDVEVLSKAYNMGKTDIQLEIIPMDSIHCEYLTGSEVPNPEMEECLALLIDKDFLRVFDTLMHFEPQRNAHGLFTNYFLHIHQILSLSRFKNAVAIGTKLY